jgi:phthalate 4,5-dioxygenase oxygenase subunit
MTPGHDNGLASAATMAKGGTLMLTAEENDLLCRVEGDAPMGQIMRRHWLPACLSEEVAERDGAPVVVRLLGEDLVAFRASDGRLGVVGAHCPHRRASLALGRNEECGLRCLYHGWKIDVAGNILEMPSEPAAYPTHEAAGLVWVFMGPAEEMPMFEPPAFQPVSDTRISIARIIVDCNWAQVLEGAIDSAHSSTLHASDMVPARVEGSTANGDAWLRPSTDKAPSLHVQRTPFGFRYAAIRRPIVNEATHMYVRTTLFIAPFTVQIPSNNLYNMAIQQVPMDDTHTAFHFIAWGGTTVPDVDAWRKFLGAEVGVDVDRRWRKIRTRDNDFLQDRAAMAAGDFTGIRGIPNQDIAMWETMGPIADRSQERLGVSDTAVLQFRRIMVEAARGFQAGGPAIGLGEPHIPHGKLRSFEGVVRKTKDWRTLGVSPEELAMSPIGRAAE